MVDRPLLYPRPLPPAEPVEVVDLAARPSDAATLKGWLGRCMSIVWPDEADRLPLRLAVPRVDGYRGGGWSWWSVAGVFAARGDDWPATTTGSLWVDLATGGTPPGLGYSRLVAEFLLWRAAVAASTVEVVDSDVVEDADMFRDARLPFYDSRCRQVIADPVEDAAVSGDTDIALVRWSAMQLQGRPSEGIQSQKVWDRSVRALEPAAIVTAQRIHDCLRLLMDLGAITEPQPVSKWELIKC